MSPLKIYVCGPYTAPTPIKITINVNRAIDAGVEIIRRGHVPYIPHLTHFMELRNYDHSLSHGIRLDYADYLYLDNEWLKVCDGLLYLASSPGADKELELARRLGKLIFHSVNEIPELVRA